ncbi:hypothetical protein AAHE18_17G219400 [Arachis hypogaea]
MENYVCINVWVLVLIFSISLSWSLSLSQTQSCIKINSDTVALPPHIIGISGSWNNIYHPPLFNQLFTCHIISIIFFFENVNILD